MTFLHLVTSCYTTAMAAICSSCGQVDLDEARFCSACGHAIAVAHRTSVASPSPTVFVGRQRELQALRAHLDAAFGGVGSLAMLVGEAGIGKISTARASRVSGRPPMDPGLRRLASTLAPARQSACNANSG
jgi:transcriptional regulator with AAA-type ATPase domain